MILLDAPYVSEFLKSSVKALNLPVLDTPAARAFAAGQGIVFKNENELANRMESGLRILTNSENSLDRLFKAACGSDLARQVEICKDKALFRETTAPLYPGYRFTRVSLDDLETVDISDFPFPFVIKPSRGFFSLGVHMVFSPEQWPETIATIRREQDALNDEYPAEVVDSGEFIIEQGLDGEEYAIDVYYTGDGELVITNILFHQFAGADDVSDRLYYTSAEIVRTWLKPFTEAANNIGKACNFRDFPMHLEVRVDADGTIIPIEANPLRFAGWCVADITHHAWGFNPYEYYFNDLRPDWPSILEQRQGVVCGMVIGDVPPEIDRQTITSVDYDEFCKQFDTVLELRKIDYTAYPVFAFTFVQTTEDRLEALKAVLKADFARYIITK